MDKITTLRFPQTLFLQPYPASYNTITHAHFIVRNENLFQTGQNIPNLYTAKLV